MNFRKFAKATSAKQIMLHSSTHIRLENLINKTSCYFIILIFLLGFKRSLICASFIEVLTSQAPKLIAGLA